MELRDGWVMKATIEKIWNFVRTICWKLWTWLYKRTLWSSVTDKISRFSNIVLNYLQSYTYTCLYKVSGFYNQVIVQVFCVYTQTILRADLFMVAIAGYWPTQNIQQRHRRSTEFSFSTFYPKLAQKSEFQLQLTQEGNWVKSWATFKSFCSHSVFLFFFI